MKTILDKFRVEYQFHKGKKDGTIAGWKFVELFEYAQELEDVVKMPTIEDYKKLYGDVTVENDTEEVEE